MRNDEVAAVKLGRIHLLFQKLDAMNVPQQQKERPIVARRHSELREILYTIRRWIIVGLIFAFCIWLFTYVTGRHVPEWNPRAHVVTEADTRRSVEAIKARIERTKRDTKWIQGRNRLSKTSEEFGPTSESAKRLSE